MSAVAVATDVLLHSSIPVRRLMNIRVRGGMGGNGLYACFNPLLALGSFGSGSAGAAVRKRQGGSAYRMVKMEPHLTVCGRLAWTKT